MDGYSGKGPLRMGHVNKDLDGRGSQSLLEAGAPNRRKNQVTAPSKTELGMSGPKGQCGWVRLFAEVSGGRLAGWGLLGLTLTEKLAGV